MSVDVSPQQRDKLAIVDDYAVLDSEFIEIKGRPEKAEKTQGAKGWYIASPEDGYLLHGPFA